MGVAERVAEAVGPWLSARGLSLYDVEHGGGVLRILVNREGGIDLDALSEATRGLSALLDDLDPIPGRYTLEVSTPGIERPLRTPTHFAGAVGEQVTVRTAGGRARGVLTAADDHGVRIRTDDEDEEREIPYGEIERARTVFEWGPAPKPGGSPKQRQRREKKASTR